jgi:hypothetical protein
MPELTLQNGKYKGKKAVRSGWVLGGGELPYFIVFSYASEIFVGIRFCRKNCGQPAWSIVYNVFGVCSMGLEIRDSKFQAMFVSFVIVIHSFWHIQTA